MFPAYMSCAYSVEEFVAEYDLPLNPRVFALLVALTEGPMHGYAIKQEVEARSGGRMTLDAGSLYRSLSRMLDDEWVEETDERPSSEDDDPRRRYYQLTKFGREALRAEAQRLELLLAGARRAAALGPSDDR